MKFFDNKKAWIEAITDTAIGTVINFPLNLAVLYFAFNSKMSLRKKLLINVPKVHIIRV